MAASWQFWAVLAAFAAALTALFAKLGVSGIDPDLATFLRTAVVILALGLILAATGKWRLDGPVPARSWVFLVLSGLATGASWVCYFRALQLGEVAKVAPVDKLSVVLVALMGVLFLGERLSAAGWLGVGLIAAGTLLLAWRG
nr:EamA family transporter [Geminicoccus harenae]